MCNYLAFYQASGVKVDSSCKKAYDDLHNKHLHSYIIFRISDDDTTIIVEKKGEKASPYAEFIEVRVLSVHHFLCYIYLLYFI